MIVLEEVKNKHVEGLYIAECPGCKMGHQIHTQNKDGPNWTFNNNMEKPTFSPSLLVRYSWGEEQTKHICHSFIRDGQWQFLSDCTHALVGKTVPMLKINSDN